VAEVIAILAIVIGLFGVITLMIGISAVLNGWVLSILWAWFIVPLFHLPQLSLPAAIGLALIANMLRGFNAPQKDSDEKDKKWGTLLARIFLAPLFVLFFGWVVHLWM
jgi:hypothetical protein